jgi:hypothetical protein
MLGPLIRLLRLSSFEPERAKTLTEPQVGPDLTGVALAVIRHRSDLEYGNERHPHLFGQSGQRAEMAGRFVEERSC